MRSKKNVEKMKKDLDYHGYMEEENSDYGWGEGCDSDEEAWSADESPTAYGGGFGSEEEDMDVDGESSGKGACMLTHWLGSES